MRCKNNDLSEHKTHFKFSDAITGLYAEIGTVKEIALR